MAFAAAHTGGLGEITVAVLRDWFGVGLQSLRLSPRLLTFMLSAEILTAGWRSYCPWLWCTSALRGVGMVVWSLLVSRSALFAA